MRAACNAACSRCIAKRSEFGPNLLEFTEHTRAVARLLFKHTEINCEDVTGLKFICCDLDTELTTVVDASGGSEHVCLSTWRSF